MFRLWRQGLSVFLSVLFLSPSLSGEPAELVGVAKASGRAEINGLPFPGESNVYSGDRVSTGQKSALTLFTAPQEKIYIAPGSSARLLKDNDANVVALEQGSATFGTVGHTRLAIDRYDVTIRSQSDFPSIAQVTLFKGRGARVWALKGAVEVVGGESNHTLADRTVSLNFRLDCARTAHTGQRRQLFTTGAAEHRSSTWVGHG